MATVTPYNDLTGNKTISGTWTLVSGPGPAAPGVYNGTLNFTGTTDGVSVYRYTVTSGGCSDSSDITYDSITPATRTNDACAGAMPLTSTNTSLYNDERCPGLAAPTNSGIGAPAAWASTPADIWYKIFIPTSSTTVTTEVIVDGSPYSDGIDQPMLAAYSGTCGALVEEDSSISATNIGTVNFTVVSGSTPETIYIRVASPVGLEGQFDITVNTL